MNKLARAVEDVRRGWGYGYPVCCIAQYTVGRLGGGPDHLPAVRRGCVTLHHPDGSLSTAWVPCSLCKGRSPHYEPPSWVRDKRDGSLRPKDRLHESWRVTVE